MKPIASPTSLPIFYKGPSLEQGKLPAFFYFALSGSDSLNLAPFNQPAALLSSHPLRVFSFTIPGHGEGLENNQAMNRWADATANGTDLFAPFFDQCLENIEYLIRQNLVDENRLAIGGLSRGGFIALHLACRDPRLKTVLAFAPLLTLAALREFSNLHHHRLTQTYQIEIPKLIGKKVRIYIGNRDLRVSTDACYQFVRDLTDLSYEKQIRSPEVELILSPSIGQHGHGTPPHIFQAGAEWIASLLTGDAL